MGRVAIVGAGLGGLAAAIRLQAEGHEVSLIEKREKVGGRAYQFQQNGYTFDMGPTIVTAPNLLEDLWRSAGRDFHQDVRLVEMAPSYRICFADGRHFDYGGSDAEVVAQIAKFNPADVDGYRRFMQATSHIYRRAFEDLAGQPFHRLATFLSVVPELLRLNAVQSVYDFVSRYIQDPYLRMVFSFHPLFIGGNPFRASAIYAIVPYLEREGGVHYALGGTYSIVEAMCRLFESLGGEVRTSTAVEEVIVDEYARAQGVLLEGGGRILTDAVVVNADVATTYLKLVPKRFRRWMSDARIKRLGQSMSCYLLYLGLDRQYPQLRHHTVIMADRYRGLIGDIFDGHGLADDFSLYLHTPTRTDPAMAPEGCEAMYVLAPVPHLGRGIDWLKESPAFRDRLIQFLENDFGLEGLSSAIKVERRFTPLDFRDELSSYLGSAFSIEPTLLQSAWLRPHNKSEDIKDLYLVGAGTHPGAGIPGVLLSAKITAELVSGEHPLANRRVA